MRCAHHTPRRRRLATTERAQRDRGYVLVEFAFLLVPLLLMVGLSVDVGYWYNRVSDLQKAADAAALAGVVWLPDEDKAEQYALAAASRNGFVDGVDGITVTVAPVGERRLRVTIRDPEVDSFFYRVLGGRTLDLSRKGTAEYVLPVPLGSPKNYFGTGRLLDDPELIYQSVNPACTSKVNGDRHQSLHFSSSTSLSSCPGTPSNQEYRDEGYGLYIEAPEGRPSNIDVLLYDPRYNDSTLSGTCVQWGNWTDLGSTRWVQGLLRYWNGSEVELPEGQYAQARYVRYCTSDTSEPAIDSKRRSGNEDFTYTLYAPDNTPFDDSDNPEVCSETYSTNTPFDRTYLGSRRWNTLCTIDTSMPSGSYILRVTNGAPGDLYADGSNQWGLVAKYQGAAGDGLCDGRNDPVCPRVYGRDAISVYANTSSASASFFLAEIPDYHVGKTLELELWDPGEGGSHIEILQPSGSDSFAPKRFSWQSFNNDGTTHSSGTDVWNVSVLNSQFNGRLLRIRINLNGYDPPADNQWWKIRYTFDDDDVTDRTTWSAKVIGDPVHLIEEDL